MSLETRKSAHLEDPGAEALDQLTGFWERHGRNLLIAVAAVAVVGLGLFFFQRSRAANETTAAGKLAEANALYWQGGEVNWRSAVRVSEEVAKQHPGTQSALDAHRIAGDASFWVGDFDRSVTEYRAYLEGQSGGLLADGVRRSLAYALESQRDSVSRQPNPESLREAAKLYEGLVGKYDRETSAEFLMSAARVQNALGQAAEEKRLYERVVSEFGETTIAQRARLALAELAAR